MCMCVDALYNIKLRQQTTFYIKQGEQQLTISEFSSAPIVSTYNKMNTDDKEFGTD